MTDHQRLGRQGLSSATRLRSPDYLHHRSIYRELERRQDRFRGVVVDVGCGNQPYREALMSMADTYIGADVLQEGSPADVEIVNERIDLPDSVADAALCTQVIEHSPRPARLIADIARVLKPGGTLLLTAPFYWPHHEEPHDYFRFTRYGLRKLCTDADMSVEDEVPCGGRWSVAGLAMIHATQSRFVRLTVNAVLGVLDRRAGDTPDWQTSTILIEAQRL